MKVYIFCDAEWEFQGSPHVIFGAQKAQILLLGKTSVNQPQLPPIYFRTTSSILNNLIIR